MANPVRESQQERRSRLHRGVRGRSFDVLLHCFADAVGADTTMLVARDQHLKRAANLVAVWTRQGREPTVSWTSDSLIGRAFQAEGAIVESTSNGDGGGHRAVAAAVSSHERVVGAIKAGFEPPSDRSPAELVWVADSYAGLAGLCMSGRDVGVATALGSVDFDPLTGCLSDGGLIEVLSAEILRAQRHGHRLACCVIDLDGLSRVNDGQGDVDGNRVLSAVGGALRSAVRRYDAVGRFGGNRFLIVLPETGHHRGRRLAERLLAGARLATAESTTVRVGVSLGILEWDREESPTDLMEAADRMMRDAKAGGVAGVHSRPSASGRLDGMAELTRQLVRPRLRAEAANRRDNGASAGRERSA